MTIKYCGDVLLCYNLNAARVYPGRLDGILMRSAAAQPMLLRIPTPPSSYFFIAFPPSIKEWIANMHDQKQYPC